MLVPVSKRQEPNPWVHPTDADDFVIEYWHEKKKGINSKFPFLRYGQAFCVNFEINDSALFYSTREGVTLELMDLYISDEGKEYEPCGCDKHGDHLGCSEDCEGWGCSHPLGRLGHLSGKQINT